MSGRSLLCSPHDDDSCLFGSFTLVREAPIVAVVLDSYIQPNRGEVGCSAQDRARETAEAHTVLGVETLRLGLRDDTATYEQILDALLRVIQSGFWDCVYAPAIQHGNRHHDDVGRAAVEACEQFAVPLKQYTTYTRTELWTKGAVEIVPTQDELWLKEAALSCYRSQLRINRPHFEAVRGKSEWLV